MKRESELGKNNERHDQESQIGIQFDRYGSKDGITEILSIIKPFLDSSLIPEKDHVVAALEECRTLEDRDVFIDRVLSALTPVMEFKKASPEEFQRLKRESNKTIGLNEATSYNRALYGTGEEQVFFHVDPAVRGDVLLEQVKEGLEKLAQIIEADASIQVINADSWITAKNPKILEKLGFTLGEVLSDEERKKHFSGEDRPVRKSSMTREEFLKRPWEK